jgi:hypothetical protein
MEELVECHWPTLIPWTFQIFVLIFFGGGVGLRLKLRAWRLSSLQSTFALLFLEMGSLELFAWAGLEPPSSWSQPSKQLGL